MQLTYSEILENKYTPLWRRIVHSMSEDMEKIEGSFPLPPLFKYTIIVIEKIGLPVVFCAFMAYMWLGMLAKSERQEERLITMHQENYVAINEMSRSFRELKEVILLTHRNR